MWNPNRCTVQDLVLRRAKSPSYDLTPWIESIDFEESSVFETSDDPVASKLQITLTRKTDAQPIPIDERTLLDGAPVRLYQGDARIDPEDWPCIFTGVIRGNPSVTRIERKDSGGIQTMTIAAYDRAEQFLNRIVIGRSYDTGTDVGKASVETAIEYLGLDRREIGIGEQGFALSHEKNHLVDIEALNGIYELLFPVLKKPRFDSNGILIAADMDLNKPPARVYSTWKLVETLKRSERLQSANNAVKVLGLSNVMTQVCKQNQRLAVVTLTSGWFEMDIKHWVWFSTDKTVKAKDTYMHTKHEMGISGTDSWHPILEADGFTTFRGYIAISTGFYPALNALITWIWAGSAIAFRVDPGAWEMGLIEIACMITILGILQRIGRGEYEIYGIPFENVYQQLSAFAWLLGTSQDDWRETEKRNDLLYTLDLCEAHAKELLRRELAKGHTYTIRMIDDPFLETDDIIQFGTEKYYITNIKKRFERPQREAIMEITAWRIA